LQQKQSLLGSIILVSHNNILKIALWPHGYFDVIGEVQYGGFMDILVVLCHARKYRLSGITYFDTFEPPTWHEKLHKINL